MQKLPQLCWMQGKSCFLLHWKKQMHNWTEWLYLRRLPCGWEDEIQSHILLHRRLREDEIEKVNKNICPARDFHKSPHLSWDFACEGPTWALSIKSLAEIYFEPVSQPFFKCSLLSWDFRRKVPHELASKWYHLRKGSMIDRTTLAGQYDLDWIAVLKKLRKKWINRKLGPARLSPPTSCQSSLLSWDFTKWISHLS